MTLYLPQLPGISFPLDNEIGQWSTATEVASSGLETRYALRTKARYKRSMVIDGLDSVGQPTALQASSYQSLVSFFNQCYGSALPFMFWAPEDNYALTQQFGTGDGVTTAFQLSRTVNGWNDYVYAPLNPNGSFAFIPSASAPYSSTANVYAPVNVAANSVSPTGAWASDISVTQTNGQADPFGTSLAVLFNETTASAQHYVAQSSMPIVVGSTVTFSIYLKYNGTTQYVQLEIDSGTAHGCAALFDLVNGVIIGSGHNGTGSANVATISAVSGGWYRCSIQGIIGTFSAARLNINFQNNSSTYQFGPPTYAGSVAQGVYAAFPQVEIDTGPGQAPSLFNPTLATRYYGGPSITVGGVYQDPSTYTLGTFSTGDLNGRVTFGSAPAVSAVIAWTGNYYWWANWDDDKMAISQFAGGFWEVRQLSFTTRTF